MAKLNTKLEQTKQSGKTILFEKYWEGNENQKKKNKKKNVDGTESILSYQINAIEQFRNDIYWLCK